MIFHDVTIVIGSVTSRRAKDTTSIAPAAIEVFRALLDRHGEHFRVPLPVHGLEHIELLWDQHGAAALGTFWSRGAPVTTSAFASGIDPGDDQAVLGSLQDLVMKFHADSPAEPAFDLLSIADRPLLATMPVPVPSSPAEMMIIADAETCLAAAFFLALENE